MTMRHLKCKCGKTAGFEKVQRGRAYVKYRVCPECRELRRRNSEKKGNPWKELARKE